MSLDDLWNAYLTDRTIANRNALAVELLPLVVSDVMSHWIFAKSAVTSEAGMQVIEVIDAGAVMSVPEIGRRVRRVLYKEQRQPDVEQEKLRELTEKFGSDTSEWGK